MLSVNEVTSRYEHEYFFEFKGEKYRVHSIVKLTEEGRRYLKFARKEVILTEVFFNPHCKRTCWKYEGKDIKPNIGINNKNTDRPPDELIEEIVMPASAEYASREILGTSSPVYKTNATKHTKKDWEIPELRKAWIIFVLVFIGISIFADWYVQLILRFIASSYFWKYRMAHINAYTTYTHDEDDEMFKKKYHALYGIRSNEEDKNNE